MQAASASFTRIAREVSRRVAELLEAHAYVTDAHGTVVAASEPSAVGRRLDGPRREVALPSPCG